MTESRYLGRRESATAELVRNPCDDPTCTRCYGDPADAQQLRRAGSLPDRAHRIFEQPETD
jgi:hypothetical protein